MKRRLTEIVTIDGPAGAGKSTVSRAVAKRLGFAFLDTGAMYRAATWWALHNNVDMKDTHAIVECTQRMQLNMTQDDGTLCVQVNGRDVTDEIRTPNVTESIKNIDAIPAVRAQLTELQRKIAAQTPTVAEGRDMGTVVFPDAKCKVYLDAALDVRAKRRAQELTDKGYKPDYTQVREDIQKRDESDSTRENAPLRIPGDATVIDTSTMTSDDVIDAVVSRARERFQ